MNVAIMGTTTLAELAGERPRSQDNVGEGGFQRSSFLGVFVEIILSQPRAKTDGCHRGIFRTSRNYQAANSYSKRHGRRLTIPISSN